jgi:hypothetical protein
MNGYVENKCLIYHYIFYVKVVDYHKEFYRSLLFTRAISDEPTESRGINIQDVSCHGNKVVSISLLICLLKNVVDSM